MKKAAALLFCLFLVASLSLNFVSAGGLSDGTIPVEASLSPASKNTKKILLIGNSYTYYNHFDDILKNICESAGQKVSITSVTKGSACLARFASKKTVEGKKVHQLLAKQKWDYVVLQERRYFPLTAPNKMRKAVLSLKPYIKASGAKLALFMTWAPAAGHEDYTDYRRLASTRKEYQSRIASAYESIAKDTNAIVIPTGLAFYRTQQQHTGIRLIRDDKSHPTFAGSYLSARTMYAALFHDSSVVSYTGRLKASDARLLQQNARRTVKQYKKGGPNIL